MEAVNPPPTVVVSDPSLSYLLLFTPRCRCGVDGYGGGDWRLDVGSHLRGTDADNGLFAVQMQLELQILTGHPSNTKNWQRFYFYVRADEAAFEEPPGDDFRALWSPRLGRQSISSGFALSWFWLVSFCCFLILQLFTQTPSGTRRPFGSTYRRSLHLANRSGESSIVKGFTVSGSELPKV